MKKHELKGTATMKGLLILAESKDLEGTLIIKQTENIKFHIDKRLHTIYVKFKKENKEFFFVDGKWETYEQKVTCYEDLKMIHDFTRWLLVNIKQRKTVKKCNTYKLAYKQLIRN